MEKEIKELEKMLQRKSDRVLVRFAEDFTSILNENIDCVAHKAENNVYEFGFYWEKDNKEYEEFVKIDKNDLKENIVSLMYLLPIDYKNNEAHFDAFIIGRYNIFDYLKCEAIDDTKGKKITFVFLDGTEYIFNIFEEQDKPLVKTISKILKELE